MGQANRLHLPRLRKLGRYRYTRSSVSVGRLKGTVVQLRVGP